MDKAQLDQEFSDLYREHLRDVYSYAYYGRIAGVYGGNPYVQTPLDYPTDALWKFVGPIWVNTRAVYGPAWSALSW